jgi:hypothetical protein
MRNIFGALFVVLIISLLIMRPTSSYADFHGHDGHGRDGGHGHDGGHRHEVRHDRSFVSFDFSVWPGNYYYGAPYYPYYPPDMYDGDNYQVATQPVTNYQQPATVLPPTVDTDNQLDSLTINIPNDKGSYTAITLKKSGNGYVGPQGEFYPEFPKVAKLKVIYGK